jgi:sulfur carrier protein
VRLVVNGDPIEIEDRSTVATLVDRVVDSPGGRGTAVAINGEVVPRTEWPQASLEEGDRVEVLKAVGGG